MHNYIYSLTQVMGFLQVTRRLIAEQDSELETSLVIDREKVSKLYNTEFTTKGGHVVGNFLSAKLSQYTAKSQNPLTIIIHPNTAICENFTLIYNLLSFPMLICCRFAWLPI